MWMFLRARYEFQVTTYRLIDQLGHACGIRPTPYYVQSPTYDNAIPLIGMDSQDSSVRSNYLVGQSIRQEFDTLLESNQSTVA